MITIINLHGNQIRPANSVYIGRGTHQYVASPLANPFRMRREADRAFVIRKYESWLTEQLASNPVVRREMNRLLDMAKGGNLILACWCHPAACHGDVIKRLLEQELDTESMR